MVSFVGTIAQNKSIVRGFLPDARCVANECTKRQGIFVDTFTVQVDGRPVHEPDVCLTEYEAWKAAALMVGSVMDDEAVEDPMVDPPHWTRNLMSFGLSMLPLLSGYGDSVADPLVMMASP